jgi:hypothetical protein
MAISVVGLPRSPGKMNQEISYGRISRNNEAGRRCRGRFEGEYVDFQRSLLGQTLLIEYGITD